MKCPYHPENTARLPIPAGGGEGSEGGWIGWLEGCCSLPAWRCPHDALQPIEAQFCTWHGCERPHPGAITHEIDLAQRARLLPQDRREPPAEGATVAAPGLVQRSLEQPPATDGKSTPALAGNVLVYLGEGGRLLAFDFGGAGRLLLAAGVLAAALRVRGGDVIGALQVEGGVRYLAWDVRDLREGLRTGATVAPREVPPTGVHLLGLPGERTRLHQGAGPLRLVVEHDPVVEEVAEPYRQATGLPPGEYLIRRAVNPRGPTVPHADLRPQILHQVPVPLPGGTFLIGQIRWFGRNVSGALLVPTVGGHVAVA